MSDANKTLVRKYIDIINQRHFDVLDNILTQDFVRHSYSAGEPEAKGCGDLIQYLRIQESIFPKFEEHILDMICEENKVAARISFKGTQLGAMGPYPASCKDADIQYLAIFKIENNLISEAWIEWDNYSIMKQLGHLDMMKINEQPSAQSN